MRANREGGCLLEIQLLISGNKAITLYILYSEHLHQLSYERLSYQFLSELVMNRGRWGSDPRVWRRVLGVQHVALVETAY
jgi:hypothetical protein